jgi:hypothetical protein
VRSLSISLVILGSLFASKNIFGQTNKLDFSVWCLDCNKSVVYANDNDGLPQIIMVKGVVVDVATNGTLCGTFTTAGSIKVKLDPKVQGFSDEYIHVVLMCLIGNDPKAFIGRSVDFEAKKMTKFPFTFQVELAAVETHGKPFYLSSTPSAKIFPRNLFEEFR